jgi:hypothetical protein
VAQHVANLSAQTLAAAPVGVDLGVLADSTDLGIWLSLDFRIFASKTGDRVICALYPGRVPPGLRILESYGRYRACF